MGQVYQWKRNERIFGYEEFMAAAKDCKKVCEAAGVPISMEADSAEPPIFTKDTIRFNGLGSESGQTFLVKRVDVEAEGTCATSLKPYDACVTACLVVLRDVLGFVLEPNPNFEEAEARVKDVLEDK